MPDEQLLEELKRRETLATAELSRLEEQKAEAKRAAAEQTDKEYAPLLAAAQKRLDGFKGVFARLQEN